MSNEHNPLIPGDGKKPLSAAVLDNPLMPGYGEGIKRVSVGLATSSKSLAGSTARPMLSAPDAAQLVKINQFSKRTLEADEVIVGQMRLANNAIDRDNERFSEEVLKGFLSTIVRKTLLLDHDRNVNRSAVGKFFDVELERMDVAKAKAETGENLNMPAGISEVQFLSPWFYIPRKGISEQDLARLESGIFDFASIGFAAEKLIPISDGHGNVLYHEYQGRGEANEGSIVYLGAQYGASIKAPSSKVAGTQEFSDANHNPLVPEE